MNVLYLLCVFAVAVVVGAGLVIVSYSRWNIYAPPLQHKYLYKYGTIHLGELRGGILPIPGTLLHYSVQGGLTTLVTLPQRDSLSFHLKIILCKCINILSVIFSEHPLYLHDPSLSEHPVYHITQIVSQSWGQVPLLAVVVTGHLDTGHHHRSSVYSNINANDASIVCEVCK